MVYKKEVELTIMSPVTRFELCTALATCYDKDKNSPHVIEFTVEQDVSANQELGTPVPFGYTYFAQINKVEYENGSGNSFNIAGILLDDGNGAWKGIIRRDFVGHLNTKSHCGRIKFTAEYADNKSSRD